MDSDFRLPFKNHAMSVTEKRKFGESTPTQIMAKIPKELTWRLGLLDFFTTLIQFHELVLL